MKFRISSTCTTIILALIVAGCAAPEKRELSLERMAYVALPNGHDPLNPDQFIPELSSAATSAREGVTKYYERKRGHPLKVLMISGGGQNGAFGAGFVKGWTESGTRPQFDLVTGVSTGALMATHAFLGTPADDAVLEQLFTGITSADIYRKRPLLSILTGNSLMDTSPMKALIDKHITQEVVDRVGAEYDKNRRLWMGTTNMDYNQTWAWNMTLIAKDGDLELYRNVMLASAAPAIAFPPVEIHGHLFADGATRDNMLVIGLTGKDRPGPPLYGPGDFYVIYNGRLADPPRAVTNGIVAIAGTSIFTMMNSSMQSILLRAYFGARTHGYRFNMVQIPADVDVGGNPLAFDPEQMRRGFDAGHALGRQQPNSWEHEPPIVGEMPDWALEAIRTAR